MHANNELIELVQGNNRPYIRLTLTRIDGTVIDVSSPTTTVKVHFCSADSKEVLTTLETTKLEGGTTGKVVFNFPGDALKVLPGYYEGEVELDFSGEKHVLYERLQFYVRDKFD